MNLEVLDKIAEVQHHYRERTRAEAADVFYSCGLSRRLFKEGFKFGGGESRGEKF